MLHSLTPAKNLEAGRYYCPVPVSITGALNLPKLDTKGRNPLLFISKNVIYVPIRIRKDKVRVCFTEQKVMEVNYCCARTLALRKNSSEGLTQPRVVCGILKRSQNVEGKGG